MSSSCQLRDNTIARMSRVPRRARLEFDRVGFSFVGWASAHGGTSADFAIAWAEAHPTNTRAFGRVSPAFEIITHECVESSRSCGTVSHPCVESSPSCGMILRACGGATRSCDLISHACDVRFRSSDGMFESCDVPFQSCDAMFQSCDAMFHACDVMFH